VVALAVIILAVPVGWWPDGGCEIPWWQRTSSTRWSVQVDQVDSGKPGPAYSCPSRDLRKSRGRIEKTKQFQQVFRDGDLRAVALPNLAGAENNR